MVLLTPFLTPEAFHCLQMIAAPRARVTHRIVSTDALFVPMALAYAFLLAHSWQADTLKLILPGSLQEGFSGILSEPFNQALP